METEFSSYKLKFLLDNTAVISNGEKEFKFSPKGLESFLKMFQDKVEKNCKLKNGYSVDYSSDSYLIRDDDTNECLSLTKEEAAELNRICTLGI